MGRVIIPDFGWTNVFFQPRWAGERKPAKLSVNHIKRKFCFPGEKSHSQSRVLSGVGGEGSGKGEASQSSEQIEAVEVLLSI